MDLRIRQLRCFATLALTLDYKKASAILQIPLPTVQFQIRGLEESFSTRLFTRQKSKLSLTASGRRLLTSTERILGAIGQLQEQMQQPAEKLSLNLCCSQVGQENLLSDLMRCLSNEQPGLTIEVVTLLPDDRIQALLSRRVDLLMMVPPTRAPGVIFQHLLNKRQHAVVPDTPRYRSMKSISIFEFARNPVLLARDGECTYARNFVLSTLEQFGITPQTLDTPIHRSTRLAMVAAGRGVTFGVDSDSPSSLPGVRELPFDEDVPPLPLGMAWRAQDSAQAVDLVRHALANLTFDAMTMPLEKFALYARLPAASGREHLRRRAS